MARSASARVAVRLVDVQRAHDSTARARDAAPVAIVDSINVFTLVSKRLGCVVTRPALDLAAACLR